MHARQKILLYILFAVLATLVNLGVQRVVLGVGPQGLGLWPAMIAGTAAGLVLKYALDKAWIFQDRSSGVAAHSRRFGLYSAMGLVTTAIFWITELVFWTVGGTEVMRELGAVIGLGIGYVVKFQLDRRFVFTPEGARG